MLVQVLAELRFSVHQLSEDDTSVKFDLQIVRYGPERQALFWSPLTSLHCRNEVFGPGWF